MRNKRTKQILALLMTLVISLATLAPATVSAEAGANNGSEVIYANDFSSGSVQTNVGQYVFAAENYAPVVADGTLTVTKTVSGAYVSIRPDNEGPEYENDGAKAMKGDLTLSFKLMINNSTDEIGTLKCGDKAVNRTALQFLSIKEASIRTSGVNQAIALNEWNAIEVVFNYDMVSAKFASYTVVLNGEILNTVAITDGPAYINSFELFRWGTDGASFKLDDVHLAFGAGSTSDLYKVDFEGVDTVPTQAAPLNKFRVMNNYDPAKNAAAKTKVANGILSLVNGGGQAFVDANVDATSGYRRDMTLSTKIRPTGKVWNNGVFIQLRTPNNVNIALAKFGGANSIVFGSKTVELSTYRFSTVEVMFHYDYTAQIYAAADLYVNGEFIATQDLSAKSIAQINWFRLFESSGENFGLDIDLIRVGKHCKLIYEGETAVTEFIGYQTTAANTESNTFNLRLLAITTDEALSKYENVGFKVTATYGNTTMTLPEELGVCTAVYESVTASAGIETVYTAEALGGSGIFALNCLNLPTQSGAITFTVTTYYTVAGQESVEERSFTFTVDPSTDIPKGGVN